MVTTKTITVLFNGPLLFLLQRMEAFPEVASMALQALSGLLAQRPCPLSEDRLCQILMVNMFNLDRAAMFTAQSAVSMVAATEGSNGSVVDVSRRQQQQHLQRKPKVESETLRSVHHDHAARFALDTFSLICRRAAKLFTEVGLFFNTLTELWNVYYLPC